MAGFLKEFASATILLLDEVLMPLLSPGESSCGVLYPVLVFSGGTWISWSESKR